MSRPVDYCTVEFDFLTGGTNCTFMSLTSAQRFAYLCAWSYAVHLRKSHLTNYEIENRLGAIYDIDRRTVAKMLQICCKDAGLLVKTDDGYNITGVMLKHGKLKKFTTDKTPTKTEKPVDSIVQYSIVQDSIEDETEPDLFKTSEDKKLKPKPEPKPEDEVDLPYDSAEFKDSWDELIRIRKVKKAVNSEKALKLLVGKICKFSSTEEEAISLLNTSIEHSWKTVYESKDNPQRTRESFERKNKKYPEGEEIHNGVPDM